MTGIEVHKEAKRIVYDALELEVQAVVNQLTWVLRSRI